MEDVYEVTEEEEKERQARLQLIQQLFSAFSLERSIKEKMAGKSMEDLIKNYPSDNSEQQIDALSYFCVMASEEENHKSIIQAGVLSLIVDIISHLDYTKKEILEGDHCKIAVHILAKLADQEKYTEDLVKAGVVPPVLKIFLNVDKSNVRKYCVRTLFHISESAFLRHSIVEALERHPESRLQFITKVHHNAYDSEEMEFWGELLQNTDIIKTQYKPGKAWYNPADFPCTKLLENNFEIIKNEALKIGESSLIAWPEKFLHKDGWNVLGLFAFQNKLNPCSICPETTKILEQIPGLQTALFSTLKPRSHIKPHIGYYSYSELILRVHMGVVVPNGCVIKVNGEERTWEEGKCVIFDDTFRHEVWNPSYDTTRIVLMLDIAFQGNVSDRNQEFYEKSKKQQEVFGKDALISKDLIEALNLVGTASEDLSNIQERPKEYI